MLRAQEDTVVAVCGERGQSPMTDETQSSPRYYLAAERTFLAWIRTGVGLMALGFVLARFGLFLQEFNLSQSNVRVASYGLSFWFGTSLIFLCVVACIFLTFTLSPPYRPFKERGNLFWPTFDSRDHCCTAAGGPGPGNDLLFDFHAPYCAKQHFQ